MFYFEGVDFRVRCNSRSIFGVLQMVMLVKENPLLAEAEALEKCRRVMELICEKCIKQQDMNEVLAMKMHYISCVLRKCASFLKDREDKLDGLIKRWVHLGFELRTCGMLEAYCCRSDLNLSDLPVLQFAEGSRQRWLPRVSGEVYQRVHPQVSLLWRHSAAAAGAEYRSCRDCESGENVQRLT